MASYSRLHDGLDSQANETDAEEHTDPIYHDRKRLDYRKWACIFSMLILVQILIIAFVGLSGISLACRDASFINGPEPPYSPLYGDGAVSYINKDMKPEEIFQQETSPAVEEAWFKPLRDHDKLVLLPSSIVSQGKLPESVSLHLDPEYGTYSVSVYHQLHCLNQIRKSFYVDKFFANETKQNVDRHKNHCFDLLRQSILCHGDPSLVYWWNETYTYFDENGSRHYTEEYLSRSPIQRVKGAYLHWDLPTRCRDMSKINNWIEKHAFNVSKYYEDKERNPGRE